jgi:hypothetical protein
MIYAPKIYVAGHKGMVGSASLRRGQLHRLRVGVHHTLRTSCAFPLVLASHISFREA